MIVSSIRSRKEHALPVPLNKGVSHLVTLSDSLAAVFQDGQVCVWGWDDLAKKRDFSVDTDRVVFLNENQLAAVNLTGKKILSIVEMAGGEKASEMTVGQADQEVWPRLSPDRNVLMLVRRNPPLVDSEFVNYEFMTVNIPRELLGVPVKLSTRYESEKIVDYAVSAGRIAYAVGSRDEIGSIAAMDLNTGKTLYHKDYPDTLEFCSLLLSPDSGTLYAGNRNGFLYKIDASQGNILKKIQLLKEGETRSVTNDFSVLNPAFSGDGKFYVVTINPKVYILRTDSDQVIHTCSPADKLVSKIAFSPDSQFFATSDIRAGYPVKIWKMPPTGQ